MPMELTPLTRDLGLVETELDGEIFHTGRVGERDVVGVVTGMGTRLAGDAVERLLDAFDVDHVLVVGIAGAGVGDASGAGVVVPSGAGVMRMISPPGEVIDWLIGVWRPLARSRSSRQPPIMKTGQAIRSATSRTEPCRQ